MYGEGCKLDLLRSFPNIKNIESLCCTPETSITLNVNYISIQKRYVKWEYAISNQIINNHPTFI